MTEFSTMQGVQGIGNSVQGSEFTSVQASGSSFWSQLRPASWRGQPFGVLYGQASFGRRNAVHEYPFRDTPWVEDLGRQARRFTVTGFLVGDDVIARRDKLIAECERNGDGELVHPTLGLRKVALIDFSTTERWDQGRVFEIQFTFIEQGQRSFPSSTAQNTSATSAAAKAAETAAVDSFRSAAAGPLQQGPAATNQIAAQTASWTTAAIRATNDATSLLRLSAGQPGEFGRMLGQRQGITVGQVPVTGSATTMQDLLGVSSASRASVASAATAADAAAAALVVSKIDAYGAAAQGVTAAVHAAAPTPGDAVRGLLAMAAVTASDPAGGAALAGQQACIDLLRRTCLAELARAAVAYRSQSTADMLAIRGLVLSALAAEIVVAGDQGDDAVYQTFRQLRATVSTTMAAAGAELPNMVDVNLPRPMPALALAQRLYGDAGRADELVARAGPVHPAFMPTSFRALSK